MKAREIDLESIDSDTTIDDFKVSPVERVALLLVVSLIITILAIAAWSSILLAFGLEEGGGPLGMIARACSIDLLV